MFIRVRGGKLILSKTRNNDFQRNKNYIDSACYILCIFFYNYTLMTVQFKKKFKLHILHVNVYHFKNPSISSSLKFRWYRLMKGDKSDTLAVTCHKAHNELVRKIDLDNTSFVLVRFNWNRAAEIRGESFLCCHCQCGCACISFQVFSCI